MDKSSGPSRPFYELPAHIKPCSRIIQETRLQLKISSRGKLGGGSGYGVSGGGGGDGDAGYFGEEEERSRGVRTVNTQRPFTPRDSVSLWGVSQRKRPPSAITLSRLSIGEGDESRPDSGVNGLFGRLGGQSSSAPAQSGRLKPLVPKTSLGTLPSQISPPLPTPTESSVEKATLKVKSLSLDKVTSSRSKQNVEASWTLGAIIDEQGTLFGKKSRLSDSDEEEAANDVPSTDSLQGAIQHLKFLSQSIPDGKSHKTKIVSVLKRIRLHLSKGPMGESEKRHLLHVIFKLVERNQNDEDILFWSSFVLLHCNIIGSNLTTVFKMVFKSSRSKDHQEIIKDTEYLDVLMSSLSQVCPKTQTESMIYGYGTLKFICGEVDILNRIVDLGLVPIMALHLKILNCDIAEEKVAIPDAIFNGAFQLTSILRSVVGEDRSLKGVVQSGLLEELCKSLNWTIDDIDVLTNTVRILSVVSMSRLCCDVIVDNGEFCGAVVRVLRHWYAKDDVMVRLTYALGNLLANSDTMRVKLYEEPEAFQWILKVLSHYTEKSLKSPITIDILVKTTRIIANWILNPFVGSEICDDPDMSELLYGVLQLKEISPELVLCVMCALNNTSFYMNYTELDEGTVKTVEYLYQNLEMKELDARTEAVKVLGNLTRNEDVRLLSAEYMENILLSLEEDVPELLCATCGVLINIIIEEQVKPEFLRKKGVERVIRVLERSSDTMVSLMASQVLWNLLISNENQGFDSNQCISPEKKGQLKRILVDKLQRPAKVECGDRQEDDYQTITQDFQHVATDLINKL